VWILLPACRVTDRPYAASDRHAPDEPRAEETLARERALRAAVLIDAIRCLVGPTGVRERRSRQAATRWVLSRDTKSPFSFNNVCECLGFEPSRIRRLLLTPTLEIGEPLRLAVGDAARRGAPAVRRPRRSPARYVALQGGRKR
jgi:hypothetical protein